MRSFNEDRLLERADLQLWAVADGMGGHRCGDFAAQTVIDALASAEPRTAGEVRAAVALANASLHSLSGPHSVSGATLVALLLNGPRYACLWAGDSELWLGRNHAACKLTRDHSLVEELVSSGLLLEEKRRDHPYAHVVTRAIGAAESTPLEEISGRCFPGDVFLLCSDGLTSAVPQDRLALIGSAKPLEQIADELLALALDRGASDNVSFHLIRFNATGSRSPDC